MIDSLNGAAAATAASGGSSVKKSAGGQMGKDQFLKLLVAQMSHQDPLNPMDGAQYAAQLAQFSSVEQLISLNAKFDSQASAQSGVLSAVNGSAALAAIGRTVTAVGDQLAVRSGQPTPVSFTVGGAGGDATLRVMDADGRVVATRPLGTIRGGLQSLDLSSSTRDLPDGTYTYSVSVEDASGQPVKVQTYTTGRVDGIRYGADGPVLTAGGLSIPFGSVVQILAGS